MIITAFATIDTAINGLDTNFTDTTLYDTTFPVLVTNETGTVEYTYGIDYTIAPELGFFNIINRVFNNIHQAATRKFVLNNHQHQSLVIKNNISYYFFF